MRGFMLGFTCTAIVLLAVQCTPKKAVSMPLIPFVFKRGG